MLRKGLMFGCVVACYLAVDNNVSHTVATKAVCPMQSSGYLACRIESRNHGSIIAQHMHLRVHLYAAHGVMDSGSNPYGIVGGCV